MTFYVPGTQEKDLSKVIMSLQQIGPGLDTANANIATNTTAIANNTTAIANNTTAIANNTTAIAGPLTSGNVAAKSDQTTATSTSLAVTPGRQQYHPSAIKAWVKFTDTGTVAVNASYNVTSVTRNGAGDYTVTFTTAFADIHYVCMAMGSNDGTADVRVAGRAGQAQTTTTVRFLFTNNAGTPSNANPGFLAFVGNQ